MKKYLLSFAVLLAGTLAFTSCDDDDEPYVPRPVAVNNGVYVINSGNQGKNIDGSLTYVSADTWATTKDAFSEANGEILGSTPNDAIVYGGKLYVVVTGENTVEVINNKTMEREKQINTVEQIGEGKGEQPRHLAAANGKVYVSTFKGYVAAIDTVTCSVVKTYAVGSYPEGMAVNEYGTILYVANSDYGRGNGSLSAIFLATGEVNELKNALIKNPVALAAYGNDLYVLDSGGYDENWNQKDASLLKISGNNITKVMDATAMAVGGTRIYCIYAPYSSSPVVPTYNFYDMATGTTACFLTDGDPASNPDAPFSPNAIAADPVRGYVYVASYQKDPDTGYAGYALDGILYVYDMSGKLVTTCTTGVGPTAVVPNTTIVYE